MAVISFGDALPRAERAKPISRKEHIAAVMAGYEAEGLLAGESMSPSGPVRWSLCSVEGCGVVAFAQGPGIDPRCQIHAHGQIPRQDLRPWYETMDPAEYAEILRRSAYSYPDDMPMDECMALMVQGIWPYEYHRRKEAGEAITSYLVWNGKVAPYSRQRATLLWIRYHTEGGKETTEIAGKLLIHPQNGLVCLCAGKTDRTHYASDCPAPLDTVLVSFLEAEGIPWVYVFNRSDGILWRAKVAEVAAAPVAVYTTSHGNVTHRHYLARESWIQRGAHDRREGRERVISGPAGPIMREPWTEEAITLIPGGY
jgi:hypothetical protein